MTTRDEYQVRFMDIIREEWVDISTHEGQVALAKYLADAALELCGHKTDEMRGEYKAVVDAANKKVDAILEFEKQAQGRVNYTGREMLPEPIRELMDVWVEASGIKPLKRELSGWLMVGQEWLDLHVQAKDIRGALEYAKGKYAIMEPASLTKTIRSLKAGMLKLEDGRSPAIDHDAIEATRLAREEREAAHNFSPMPDYVRERLGKLKTQLEVK